MYKLWLKESILVHVEIYTIHILFVLCRGLIHSQLFCFKTEGWKYPYFPLKGEFKINLFANSRVYTYQLVEIEGTP